MATKPLVCALTLAVLASRFAWAEEAPTVPPANLAVQIFNFDAKNPAVPWIRPPEVQFVLLSGCGGGGGGGTATATGSGSSLRWVAGKGGGAATLYTILVPVKADRYDIVVGDGGGSAVNGFPTTMTGADETSITLRGGLTGSSASIDGEASPLGLGGKGSGSGENASEKIACSGGGGSSTPARGVGGKGAPGRLAIMPIPDLARFGRVMAMVEDLSRPPELPDDANSTPSEPGQGATAGPGATGSIR